MDDRYLVKWGNLFLARYAEGPVLTGDIVWAHAPTVLTPKPPTPTRFLFDVAAGIAKRLLERGCEGVEVISISAQIANAEMSKWLETTKASLERSKS